MRKLNEWEQVVKYTIEDSNKFYFLESFYKQINMIKETRSIKYAYHIFELICRYALYGEVPKEKIYSDEDLFFNGIIKDNIDVGIEMIEDKEKTKSYLYEKDGYVYIIKLNGYYKIGRTINPEKRFGEYTKLMEQPETICCIYVKNYKQVEKELHKMFSDKNTNGEWFILLDEELSTAIKYIKTQEISGEE